MDFVQYVMKNAPRYNLDPQAVIAVARTEGGLVNRADDRGDGGRSFGPHQLYEQGALPKQFVGNPDAADAWAWSPAGFEYALRKMAEAGASGLRGQSAINTIVRKFERPADPDGQVSKAIGFYQAAPTRAAAVKKGLPLTLSIPWPGSSTALWACRVRGRTASQKAQQTGSQTTPGITVLLQVRPFTLCRRAQSTRISTGSSTAQAGLVGTG